VRTVPAKSANNIRQRSSLATAVRHFGASNCEQHSPAKFGVIRVIIQCFWDRNIRVFGGTCILGLLCVTTLGLPGLLYSAFGTEILESSVGHAY